MTTQEQYNSKLKKYTEDLLGKSIVKAEAGMLNILWFDNQLDANIVSAVLSKDFTTILEEEAIIEPHVEGMTREQRRNRKFIKTGLFTVSFQ